MEPTPLKGLYRAEGNRHAWTGTDEDFTVEVSPEERVRFVWQSFGVYRVTVGDGEPFTLHVPGAALGQRMAALECYLVETRLRPGAP